MSNYGGRWFKRALGQTGAPPTHPATASDEIPRVFDGIAERVCVPLTYGGFGDVLQADMTGVNLSARAIAAQAPLTAMANRPSIASSMGLSARRYFAEVFQAATKETVAYLKAASVVVIAEPYGMQSRFAWPWTTWIHSDETADNATASTLLIFPLSPGGVYAPANIPSASFDGVSPADINTRWSIILGGLPDTVANWDYRGVLGMDDWTSVRHFGPQGQWIAGEIARELVSLGILPSTVKTAAWDSCSFFQSHIRATDLWCHENTINGVGALQEPWPFTAGSRVTMADERTPASAAVGNREVTAFPDYTFRLSSVIKKQIEALLPLGQQTFFALPGAPYWVVNSTATTVSANGYLTDSYSGGSTGNAWNGNFCSRQYGSGFSIPVSWTTSATSVNTQTIQKRGEELAEQGNASETGVTIRYYTDLRTAWDDSCQRPFGQVPTGWANQPATLVNTYRTAADIATGVTLPGMPEGYVTIAPIVSTTGRTDGITYLRDSLRVYPSVTITDSPSSIVNAPMTASVVRTRKVATPLEKTVVTSAQRMHVPNGWPHPFAFTDGYVSSAGVCALCNSSKDDDSGTTTAAARYYTVNLTAGTTAAWNDALWGTGGVVSKAEAFLRAWEASIAAKWARAADGAGVPPEAVTNTPSVNVASWVEDFRYIPVWATSLGGVDGFQYNSVHYYGPAALYDTVGHVIITSTRSYPLLFPALTDVNEYPVGPSESYSPAGSDEWSRDAFIEARIHGRVVWSWKN